MAKPSKKNPTPAKSLKPVKAWAVMHPMGRPHVNVDCMWETFTSPGWAKQERDRLRPTAKIIPVMIVPIKKKTTNKKARKP